MLLPMAAKGGRYTPEGIAEECQQWDETNQSHLVQNGQESVVRSCVVVPDFKDKWNAKAFSSRRVFLKSPPGFFPGRESKLPICVLPGVHNPRSQLISDTGGKI